jgi:hypothetical protein
MAKHAPRDYNPFDTLPKKRDLSEPGHPLPALDIQTSDHLDVKTSKRLAKSQDPTYTKFTTYIPVDLHRAVKMKLVGQGRELSDLVEELLRRWNA